MYTVLSEANKTLSGSIQELILNHINQLHTTYPAEVVSIQKNRVTIRSLLKLSQEDEPQLVPNVLVGIPSSRNLQLQLQISIGDRGLAFVCKNDISKFKSTGRVEVVNSQRTFDINDTVFIPLAMVDSRIDSNRMESESDLQIKIADKFVVESQKVEIKCDGITLDSGSEPLSIKNNIGSLHDVVRHLISMMDLLANGMAGSGTNAAQYRAGKGVHETSINQILK